MYSFKLLNSQSVPDQARQDLVDFASDSLTSSSYFNVFEVNDSDLDADQTYQLIANGLRSPSVKKLF